jgi:FkbM family methyltransferase
VLAFDPTPAANYFLNKNILLNHLSEKITAFQYALSDKTGEAEFFEVKNKKYPYLKYNLGGSSSLFNLPGDYNKITVKSFSFDDFIKLHSLENVPIDFIKIDAEGAEPFIIQGMPSTIRSYLPIIVCEILPGEIDNKLEELFLNLDYEFFMVWNNKLIPVKTLHDGRDEIIRNCFFVHPSKFHLIEEYIDRERQQD